MVEILLVDPTTPDTFWSFKHVLRLVSKRAAFPPLGLLTVAALLPTHWELRLVDQHVKRLTDAGLCWADYVMLSVMIVHRASGQFCIATLLRQPRRLHVGIIGHHFRRAARLL